MRDQLANLLANAWSAESKPNSKPLDFMRMSKDATNNVRTALMQLELHLLSQ
jgi:hypothetical protein